jgi:SAM-dependent methyltransferase
VGGGSVLSGCAELSSSEPQPIASTASAARHGSLRSTGRTVEGDNYEIGTRYDTLGAGYTAVRREDPRLAGRIRAALGDARTVVNVGAGAGSYEPADLEVIAVEPSAGMRAQRPPGAAPVVDARAEQLPFDDDSFDAAMSVLSIQHWDDHQRGLAELRRVARRRVVLFAWEPTTLRDSWLVRDYLPGFARLVPPAYTLDDALATLGGGHIEPVPIPHDCRDGFLHAYWRRPRAYLDPQVRAGISVFHLIDAGEVDRAIDRLAADLDSGDWERRHAELLELEELDLGYRLVVAELTT